MDRVVVEDDGARPVPHVIGGQGVPTGRAARPDPGR
jgi:hypothetical protein